MTQNERNKMMELINFRVKGYIEEHDGRYIFQSALFRKIGDFDSTVFYLKINQRERVILSINEDHIFEKVIVNVFAICNHEKLNAEIKGIMESLYQKMINDESYDEEDV